MKKRILPIVLVIAMVAVVAASVFYVNQSTLAFEQARETRAARVEEYAQVVAQTVQIQEGDRILVAADVSQNEFANLVAEQCYKLGAQGVQVIAYDGLMVNLQSKYLKDKEYDGYYGQYALFSHLQNTFPKYKRISIVSQYFDENQATQEESNNFSTLVEEKTDTFMKEHNLAMEPGNNTGAMPWTMVPYPTKGWAQKVYPELSVDAAYDKMLDDFLDFARIGTKISFFEHVENLMSLKNKANELGITELHYKSKTADLRVPLHKDHKFEGGQVTNQEGVSFYPNVPTEEIFTMPAKYGATGTASATRPLQLADQVVEGLKMTFQDGKLVDYSAGAGEDELKKVFETSPEGVYLGESALVPKDSPIFQSGKIYYEILLDENAGAHIALDSALTDCNLKQGAEVDGDVNEANYHIDVTIGSDDLTVTATLADGSQVDLIKNGEWNF